MLDISPALAKRLLDDSQVLVVEVALKPHKTFTHDRLDGLFYISEQATEDVYQALRRMLPSEGMVEVRKLMNGTAIQGYYALARYEGKYYAISDDLGVICGEKFVLADRIMEAALRSTDESAQDREVRSGRRYSLTLAAACLLITAILYFRFGETPFSWIAAVATLGTGVLGFLGVPHLISSRSQRVKIALRHLGYLPKRERDHWIGDGDDAHAQVCG